MPIYEYQCQACGHGFETLQKMSDPAPAECPQCHAQGQLKKLISSAGFTTKGASIDNAPACASGACGASCQGK